MSEETKQDIQKEPAETTELSNQDLEQVAGGAGVAQARIWVKDAGAAAAAPVINKWKDTGGL